MLCGRSSQGDLPPHFPLILEVTEHSRVTREPIFPSLKRTGGRDINKDDAKLPLMERTGWSVRRNHQPQRFAELTTPSAPLRWLRDFFLRAQPPLLFKEGKTSS